MLPAGEKIVLVLEAIGDDKIRVNSSSLKDGASIGRVVSQFLSDSALFTGART
jgi:hypothetical protein